MNGFQQMQASQMQALQQISSKVGDIPLKFARQQGDAWERSARIGNKPDDKPMAIMDGEVEATAAAEVSVQTKRTQPKSSVMDIIEAFEKRKKTRAATPTLDDTAN